MLYRYEAMNDEYSSYTGIFTAYNIICCHFSSLHIPSYYTKHNNKTNTCWFTQAGYDKYHTTMEKSIHEIMAWDDKCKIRLVTTDNMDDIVVHSKIQCIKNGQLPKQIKIHEFAYEG